MLRRQHEHARAKPRDWIRPHLRQQHDQRSSVCLYSLCGAFHAGGLGQNISDQVGIPNANRGDVETSGLANAINISGYSGLGNSGWIPELSADNTFQVADSLTWIRGKHTIKLGADFRRYQRNFFQSQAAFGQFSFSGQFTQDLTGIDTNGSGSGLADLLLGCRFTASRMAGPQRLHSYV